MYPSMDKGMEFDDKAGAFRIDGAFRWHRKNCDQCRRYIPSSPATLALLCLHGAILWKQQFPRKPKKPKEYA
jgi:hypothetical protein